MSDKLAVILANEDSKVLEMGLIYARNVVKNAWMSDIKLLLLDTIPQACKWCSDKYGVREKLAELGCDVEYIGAPVSEAIRDGYVPMTW